MSMIKKIYNDVISNNYANKIKHNLENNLKINVIILRKKIIR